MKCFTMPVVAGAIVLTSVGFAAAANAAPSGAVTAEQTVGQLQSQGFDVIVNKVGTAPLHQCVVNAVRPGQTFSRTDSGAAGAMDDIVTTVTAKTIYLDVTC